VVYRRKRRLFVSTDTDENAIAAAVGTGWSRPSEASGIIAVL
jgi:pyruvoyl-dependent arginine decarboxylase (PvlArgDC)